MTVNRNWRAYLAPTFTAKGDEKKSPVCTHPAVALGLGDRITQRAEESDNIYEGVLVWNEGRDDDVAALARIAFPEMSAMDHEEAAALHDDQFKILMALGDLHRYHVDRIVAHAQARNFHYIAGRLILGEDADEGQYGPGLSR